VSSDKTEKTEKSDKAEKPKTGQKRKREDKLSKSAKKRKTEKLNFQYSVDKPLLEEIKKTPQLDDYLRSRFFLTESQFPHELKF